MSDRNFKLMVIAGVICFAALYSTLWVGPIGIVYVLGSILSLAVGTLVIMECIRLFVNLVTSRYPWLFS